MQKTLLRSDSTDDLYHVPAFSPFLSPLSQSSVFTACPPSLWHKRLGHLNNEALRSVIS